MLCTASEPFDDPAFLFEIKWDGVRALLFVDAPGSIRIHNRRGTRIDDRYPDLVSAARALPAGIVLDGEIIVTDENGAPSFPRVLEREQGRRGVALECLVRERPACFVAFDVLYAEYAPELAHPLEARRQRLDSLPIGDAGQAMLVSEGIVGEGKRYFTDVTERGLEGVVAKRLASRYVPGKRSDDWRKIKASRTRACVVIGWLASGPSKNDLKSLLVATDFEDGLGLRYVGKVGTGMSTEVRDELLARLRELSRDAPLVHCDERGAQFVEPEIYVAVRYFEVSENGRLRGPVFEALL